MKPHLQTAPVLVIVAVAYLRSKTWTKLGRRVKRTLGEDDRGSDYDSHVERCGGEL